jgi:hypothetical protein
MIRHNEGRIRQNKECESFISNTQQLSLLLKYVAEESVLSVSAFESKEEYQLENVFGAASTNRESKR